MITIVVSREDHANNLRLKACLLSYNLHVRFFFEMKKKNKQTQCAADIRANFFSKANGRGGNFYRNFVFYVQKTTFQGTSRIVMDVVLLLNVGGFVAVSKLKSLI